MKKTLLYITAVAALASCQQQVVYEADYTIELDKTNTYRAGEPVKFNFSGDVDNVVFYSGETGSQYRFKDRYTVSLDDVRSAKINMTVLAQYGYKDGLDIYLTDSFEGLKGDDGEADRAAVKALFDNLPDGQDAPDGWRNIGYHDAATSGDKQTLSEDISNYVSNFCVAFHWHPVNDGKSAQRTYKLDGSVDLDIEGSAPSSLDFKALDFKVLTMNEETDPYNKNNGNGSIRDNVADFDLVFQGIGAGQLPYGLDVWCISAPIVMNKVSNDKGTVISDLQNYITNFDYVWNEPGTYKVTFVGINSNFAGSSKKIQEFTITILDHKTTSSE